MDQSVPTGALKLLEFIGSLEAPRGYDTLFSNAQLKSNTKITQMGISDVLREQPGWARSFGSSAAGRYQFIHGTLLRLKNLLSVADTALFSGDLQDVMAFELLLERGYRQFCSGALSLEAFALNLAKEWASLPVIRKVRGANRFVDPGQSYYAGVGSNAALTSAIHFESLLRDVHAVAARDVMPPVKPEHPSSASSSSAIAGTSAGTTTMDKPGNAKPWYLSKGVIGGIVSIVIPILSLFFPVVGSLNQATVTDWILKAIEIVGPIAGGLLAIWGRLTAVRPIAGTEAARQAETFLPGPIGQLLPILEQLLARGANG